MHFTRKRNRGTLDLSMHKTREPLHFDTDGHAILFWTTLQSKGDGIESEKLKGF